MILYWFKRGKDTFFFFFFKQNWLRIYGVSGALARPQRRECLKHFKWNFAQGGDPNGFEENSEFFGSVGGPEKGGVE